MLKRRAKPVRKTKTRTKAKPKAKPKAKRRESEVEVLQRLAAAGQPPLLLPKALFASMADRYMRELTRPSGTRDRRSSVVIRNFSIVLFAVDKFPGLSRRRGARTGAQVARRLGSLVLQRVRSIDLVGSWRPGEVVVGFVGTSGTEAYRVATEIKEQMGRTHFLLNSHPLACTLSAGVAGAGTKQRFASLYANAQAALRSAQKGSGNRVFHHRDFQERRRA